MKHFMTGDCLIEVTEGAGLTVYILYANMTTIFKHMWYNISWTTFPKMHNIQSVLPVEIQFSERGEENTIILLQNLATFCGFPRPGFLFTPPYVLVSFLCSLVWDESWLSVFLLNRFSFTINDILSVNSLEWINQGQNIEHWCIEIWQSVSTAGFYLPIFCVFILLTALIMSHYVSSIYWCYIPQIKMITIIF